MCGLNKVSPFQVVFRREKWASSGITRTYIKHLPSCGFAVARATLVGGNLPLAYRHKHFLPLCCCTSVNKVDTCNFRCSKCWCSYESNFLSKLRVQVPLLLWPYVSNSVLTFKSRYLTGSLRTFCLKADIPTLSNEAENKLLSEQMWYVKHGVWTELQHSCLASLLYLFMGERLVQPVNQQPSMCITN